MDMDRTQKDECTLNRCVSGVFILYQCLFRGMNIFRLEIVFVKIIFGVDELKFDYHPLLRLHVRYLCLYIKISLYTDYWWLIVSLYGGWALKECQI